MKDEFAEDLQAALVTRPIIEQAKGVLIGLRGSTPDQAFAELRHASQTHNLKLNALASALVNAAAGVPAEDPQVREIVLSEWGGLLTHCPQVIDHATVQESA